MPRTAPINSSGMDIPALPPMDRQGFILRPGGVDNVVVHKYAAMGDAVPI